MRDKLGRRQKGCLLTPTIFSIFHQGTTHLIARLQEATTLFHSWRPILEKRFFLLTKQFGVYFSILSGGLINSSLSISHICKNCNANKLLLLYKNIFLISVIKNIIFLPVIKLESREEVLLGPFSIHLD